MHITMKKTYIVPTASVYRFVTEGMMAQSLGVSSDADEQITNTDQFLSNKRQTGPWANMRQD